MPGVLGWALGANWARGIEGGVGGAQPAARGPSALSLSVLSPMFTIITLVALR